MKRNSPKRIALLGLPVLRPSGVFNAAIMRYAEEHGHWHFVFSSEASVAGFRYLREIDCDGAIARISTPELRKAALRAGCPIVNLSGWMEDAGVPSVRSDQGALGRVCAEHLLARGFRRFGVVRLWGGWLAKARADGFSKVIEAAGYTESISIFEPHSATVDLPASDLKRFQAWIKTLHPPFGLFLTDDESAQQLMDACRAEGLRIPEDVAVIAAYKHEQTIHACDPPLSHVDWAEESLALEVARYLDRLMAGEASDQPAMYVPPRGVVARRSTETLAMDDLMVARAIQYIRKHSIENINIKVIAEHLSVSRRTLERRFSRAVGPVLGLSLHQFLIRERVISAQNLLKIDPSLSNAEVARRCGFADARHMKRTFRLSAKKGME